MKVVTLTESNYRQVVPTLRKLADNIESGNLGPVGCCAVVVMGDKISVYGMGIDSDGPAVGMLLHAGAAFMTDILLDKPIEQGNLPDDAA